MRFFDEPEKYSISEAAVFCRILTKNRLFYVFFFCVLVLLHACGGQDDPEAGKTKGHDEKQPVKLVYVDWVSEKASAQVVRAVIEQKLEHSCELLSVNPIAMWESIAAGDQDFCVAAWLPSLHGDYYREHQSDVDNLGPNLEGTRYGLVVPEYVDIDSIDELAGSADRFEGRIIGIDPYAGVMGKTAEVIEEYDLEGFRLVSGSGPTMTSALEKAVSDGRPIVVTGWTPHWKFAEWDLKYLSDPKGVYGDKEHIATIARKGLKKDMPRVYEFLEKFSWSPSDMEEVMLMARSEDTTYSEAAKTWVNENSGLVSTWIE
ncbi:MAG: glycine betaine ABC transporter substrate-binding protein [Thermodesulfobacteriota bacterium]